MLKHPQRVTGGVCGARFPLLLAPASRAQQSISIYSEECSGSISAEGERRVQGTGARQP